MTVQQYMSDNSGYHVPLQTVGYRYYFRPKTDSLHRNHDPPTYISMDRSACHAMHQRPDASGEKHFFSSSSLKRDVIHMLHVGKDELDFLC